MIASSVAPGELTNWIARSGLTPENIMHLQKKYPGRQQFLIKDLTMEDLKELRLRHVEMVSFSQFVRWYSIRRPDQRSLSYFAASLWNQGWVKTQPMRAMAIGSDSAVLIGNDGGNRIFPWIAVNMVSFFFNFFFISFFYFRFLFLSFHL